MQPLEVNEVLALLFVSLACAAIVQIRRHPSNTRRTREWWGRFLVMMCLLLVAEIATNVEQFWTDEDMAHQTINLLEHLAMLGAGAVALRLGVLGLLEAFARATGEGGTDS